MPPTNCLRKLADLVRPGRSVSKCTLATKKRASTGRSSDATRLSRSFHLLSMTLAGLSSYMGASPRQSSTVR